MGLLARGGRALQWLEPSRSSRTARPAGTESPPRINGMVEAEPPTERSPDSPPRREKEEPGIEIRTALDWAERFDEFSADLNLFLMIMTGIGVTIAVLSIVNTMLMSVTERIIEFGILKANGWSRYDVLRLVTFESAILGLGGGLCGSFLGWCATQFGNWYWHDRVNLFASPELLLFAVLFSTALGILGGLYPALWAMRMMPMEAIRRG